LESLDKVQVPNNQATKTATASCSVNVVLWRKAAMLASNPCHGVDDVPLVD
jgi:hypothetical protein